MRIAELARTESDGAGQMEARKTAVPWAEKIQDLSCATIVRQ